jgi:4-hydroxybutyrate CoA-transferase
MDWENGYKSKICSPDEAVDVVRSGDRIYIGTGSSVAYTLCDALWRRRKSLENITVCSGLIMRELPFYLPEDSEAFSSLTYFAGAGERVGIRNGKTDYTSIHLSQINTWYDDIARPTVAFLEVSTPDRDGHMSYGGAGVSGFEAVRKIADRVVLEVNDRAPHVYGEENYITAEQADRIIEVSREPDTLPSLTYSDTMTSISNNIVDMIPDGATIQLGLGGISDAVGFGLSNKNDLGIHTELLTNSMIGLMKIGVVTNKRKTVFKDRSVTAFSMGSRELYDYIDNNPSIYFAPFVMVNDPYIISTNDNMISVNTAMAVDLCGEVVADCMGGVQQSATGGQVDFVRGAQLSKGGKSFIALSSTFRRNGKAASRIVPFFPPRTVITTPRSDVEYVVTEYGCVNLKKLSMSDRARALIRLAHPDFRDMLTEQAKQMKLI